MAGCSSKDRLHAAISEAAKQLGYFELSHLQTLVVAHFVEGRDVFVSLPTGSGKSLCYCILPRVFDIMRESTSTESQSVAVVISPLVALMKDQVRRMAERDMTAVYVGDIDADETVADVCGGQYQLVYMSPEALLTNMTWRDMLLSPVFQQNLVAFVVDEAHCVKKW